MRDTDDRTLGYASHTPQDWAPREASPDVVGFARFMETLRDPAQPPAPVVLVACETAKIRSGDGGSVATDAARAIPGRLWYAPDTEVGHAGPSNDSDGEQT
jgi:hypothetical protein